MKALLYVLIGIACFGLGWFSRPGGKAVHDTDTIQSPPIVVTKTRVDTLILLSPQPYIAWIDNTDTMRLDSCWHLREYKEYRDSNCYVKVVYLPRRRAERKAKKVGRWAERRLRRG